MNKQVKLEDEWIKMVEDCKQAGISPSSIGSVRMTAKGLTYSLKPQPQEDVLINIEKLVKDAVKKYSGIKKIKVSKSKKGDGLTNIIYSDTHIGMNPNKDGNSLYGGKWDAVELEIRRKEIVKKSITTNSEIHITDLGDLLDGWDSKTTRGGHHLPQNMNNCEQFDKGVEFKIRLLDDIIQANPHASIKMINVCNDNHAGDFGYLVNSAVKSIVEAKYTGVEVVNSKKFIDHYQWNNHVIVYTHGKDKEHLKFGFKPLLDKKGYDKIEGYLKANKLINRDYNITFIKGDSHQMLLDYLSSDEWDYFNMPALSPSSGWIQGNFKQGRSGFVRMDFEGDEKTITPYWFKWHK